jgi:hypothetical protein
MEEDLLPVLFFVSLSKTVIENVSIAEKWSQIVSHCIIFSREQFILLKSRTMQNKQRFCI